MNLTVRELFLHGAYCIPSSGLVLALGVHCRDRRLEL